MVNAIYFETSSINFLLDHLSDGSIINFRNALLSLPNTKLCLSPVVMWEISCTGDQERKDDLIHICQLLLDHTYVFPSPIHIMDHFISEGCPREESDYNFWEDEGPFNAVWREVSCDLDRTMILQSSIIDEDRDLMRTISRTIEALIKYDFAKIENPPNEYYEALCEFVNAVFFRASFIQERLDSGTLTCESCRQYKTAILFAICILILGMTLEGAELPSFWRKRIKSTNIMDQIAYLFSKHEEIIYHGPFAYMAKMAIVQTGGKSNRGLYKDCLHTIYMPYCTIFFTNDKHFEEIKSHEPKEFWQRIQNIEDFISGLLEFLNEEEEHAGS